MKHMRATRNGKPAYIGAPPRKRQSDYSRAPIQRDDGIIQFFRRLLR